MTRSRYSSVFYRSATVVHKHVSRILSTGEVGVGGYSLGATTSVTRMHSSRMRFVHCSGRRVGGGFCRHPQAGTPAPSMRRPLQWTVRILLECIFVTKVVAPREYP